MGLLRVRQDWSTSLSLFTFMHWRWKWQPTPVLLPGESQGQGSLVGCCLWGHTESDTTEARRWFRRKDGDRYLFLQICIFFSNISKTTSKKIWNVSWFVDIYCHFWFNLWLCLWGQHGLSSGTNWAAFRMSVLLPVCSPWIGFLCLGKEGGGWLLVPVNIPSKLM